MKNLQYKKLKLKKNNLKNTLKNKNQNNFRNQNLIINQLNILLIWIKNFKIFLIKKGKFKKKKYRS